MNEYYISQFDDKDYELFLQNLIKHFDLDLRGYKQHRLRRRTDILLKKYNLKSYSEYFELLKKDREKWDEFLNKLTINVTEFFRNPDKWVFLKNNILPEIIKEDNGKIKAWSAGCSTGEEPYTLAIILDILGVLRSSTIIGGDFDEDALEKAKLGVYPEKSLVNVPENIKLKYFKKVDEDKYEIIERIKKRVDFKKVNLLLDDFDKNFDLIICRNVVIYFDMEAKDKLYNKFYESLKPGGVLFVGSTERIFNYKEIGFSSIAPFFYKKEKK
ncbi:MAG TPA: protein-glutamate O-methyltransferase CheR [Defluviitoga sp.]|nr:protein-glutamate O-methyltransferase CheR [Defluviitoga sp.]HOP24740.1 protein-glutamate O-methyltransferase CheR [Defluviitoga sp.]HPZ28309.1 protein-glutamate O-methyltransferase CheR [Defluviitoga sp.]HQD62199.1 protein-glutamate O-methyltransferase CheR [Defluviitoga sp.]